MPIYDYHCDHCGHSFSAVQSFSDQALEKCPNCGKRPRRLFTAPAIVFKGSGWYKTDSRPTSDKSESKSEKSETKSDTAKSETKPDTKSEAKPSKPSPKNEAAS
jgi:putative FmdB family regulatory protein